MIILNDTKPKARKTHICNFCDGTIIKGEIYGSQTNVYDGDIYTWKVHIMCAEIAHMLRMYDECDEGLDEDTFRECIDEEFNGAWIKINRYFYESSDFVIPEFKEKLNFVINYHLLNFNN